MIGGKASSPALLYLPLDGSTRTRFRVLTPDLHAVATTVELFARARQIITRPTGA